MAWTVQPLPTGLFYVVDLQSGARVNLPPQPYQAAADLAEALNLGNQARTLQPFSTQPEH